MEIKSKLEARVEAFNLAINLISANKSYQTEEINPIKMAKDIEAYITEGLNLPDVTKDLNDITKEYLDRMFPPKNQEGETERCELGLMGHVPDIQ